MAAEEGVGSISGTRGSKGLGNSRQEKVSLALIIMEKPDPHAADDRSFRRKIHIGPHHHGIELKQLSIRKLNEDLSTLAGGKRGRTNHKRAAQADVLELS